MLSDYAIRLMVLFVSPSSWALSTLRTEIRSNLTLDSSSWHSTYRAWKKLLNCQPLHLCVAIKRLEYIAHILPVILLICMTASSADGPKAIKWIMAPLCFTLSTQFLAELSSPSVSSTISDPSIWGCISLITCKHN